jgi:hypothetical protein
MKKSDTPTTRRKCCCSIIGGDAPPIPEPRLQLVGGKLKISGQVQRLFDRANSADHVRVTAAPFGATKGVDARTHRQSLTTTKAYCAPFLCTAVVMLSSVAHAIHVLPLSPSTKNGVSGVMGLVIREHSAAAANTSHRFPGRACSLHILVDREAAKRRPRRNCTEARAPKRWGRSCAHPEGCQALAIQVIYGDRSLESESQYCKDHRGAFCIYVWNSTHCPGCNCALVIQGATTSTSWPASCDASSPAASSKASSAPACPTEVTDPIYPGETKTHALPRVHGPSSARLRLRPWPDRDLLEAAAARARGVFGRFARRRADTSIPSVRALICRRAPSPSNPQARRAGTGPGAEPRRRAAKRRREDAEAPSPMPRRAADLDSKAGPEPGPRA